MYKVLTFSIMAVELASGGYDLRICFFFNEAGWKEKVNVKRS